MAKEQGFDLSATPFGETNLSVVHEPRGAGSGASAPRLLERGRRSDYRRIDEGNRMSLRVLFIGGTGNISLPCVAAAVQAGHEVTLFNRGAAEATAPPGVASVVGDMKDSAAYRAIGKSGFDVVCQFVVFTPEQMARDIETFADVGQYIFISSASIYEKPPRRTVITEKTPTVNPYWPYSQNKIACEAMLKSAQGFPGRSFGRVTRCAPCCRPCSTRATS